MSAVITHTLYAVGVTWAVTAAIVGVVWVWDEMRKRWRP